MARIPKLTAKSVSKVIKKLGRQGLPITNRAIIREVGGGSNTTLKTLRKDHPDIFKGEKSVANENLKLKAEVAQLKTQLAEAHAKIEKQEQLILQFTTRTKSRKSKSVPDCQLELFPVVE